MSTFRVLLVCTANLCRSPIAEYVLSSLSSTDAVIDASEWQIESAGTRVSQDSEMHPLARQALADRGISGMDEFRSKQVSEAMVRQADLILTASLEHRSAIVRLVPSAVRRTFTMKQAARMAKATDGHQPFESTVMRSGDDLLHRILAGQSLVQPVVPDEDNLRDPMGHRLSAFRQCADTLEVLFTTLLVPDRP